jgi:hypothetical protein
VYLSPVPWRGYSQRSHKFVKWYRDRTHGDVLWVDPYPTRLPSLSDLRNLGGRGSIRQEATVDWLKITKPHALPIEPLPGSPIVNARIWKSALNEVINFGREGSALLVVGKPSAFALSVLKQLGDCLSVYDGMDNFPAFYSGLSRLAAQQNELEIIRRVNCVLVASTELKRRWTVFRPDVQLVQNGLDASKLATQPTRKLKRSKKILGYVGTIGRWFDWDWVRELARLRPNDTVRLVGPIFKPSPSRLPRNVETTGIMSHTEALQVMQEFDVGLIPFKRNELTEAVDPIKYYEYRAFGLPIVSTNFGEMKFRADEEGVFLTRDLRDVRKSIEDALKCEIDGSTISEFIARNSWDTRFDQARLLQKIS